MNAGKVNFGILLIIFGTAALMINTDAADWWLVLDLLEMWPLLLIAIGLQMVLRRTPVPQLAYASSLLLVVAGVWLLVSGHESHDTTRLGRARTIELSKLDDNTKRLEINVDVDDCDMSASGSSVNLMSCRFNDYFNRPKMDIVQDGDVARLNLKAGKFSRVRIFDKELSGRDWNLKVYDKLPAKIKFECRNSDLKLRFDDLGIEEFISETPRSDVAVKFGSEIPDVAISMNIRRSDIRIRIPASSGVEITNSSDFDEFYVGDLDFLEDGRRFYTEDFDSADVKFSFDLRGEANVFRISYY